MKSEVLAYLENVESRKEAKSGAVPMDVDSLAKGKGKGQYEKGKGKGKSKARTKGRTIGTINLPRAHGINNHGISSHGKRIQAIPRVKAKVRKAKTKAKAKVTKVKVVRLPMLSPMLGLKGNNLQQHLVINLNKKSLLRSPWKRTCR